MLYSARHYIADPEAVKIHEYQAKELLRRFDVPVPRGEVAESAQQAGEIAQRLGGPVVIKTRVRYHIMTDDQHEMLRTEYGLTGDDPYSFTIYERDFPLSGDLRAMLEGAGPDTGLACGGTVRTNAIADLTVTMKRGDHVTVVPD